MAADIARKLNQVVFVGAYAAFHYGVTRTTRDIDIALATPRSDAEFEALGFRVYEEARKRVIRTRNGIKIDVYTRDVSGIPVQDIFATATRTRAANSQIRIICLEALLLAKMRAGRPQDNEDVRQLVKLHGKTLRWDRGRIDGARPRSNPAAPVRERPRLTPDDASASASRGRTLTAVSTFATSRATPDSKPPPRQERDDRGWNILVQQEALSQSYASVADFSLSYLIVS